MLSVAARASLVAALHVAASSVTLAACGGAGAESTTPAVAPASTPSEKPAVDPDSAPAPPPAVVDCGDFSTCAIADDGLARCWGRNKEGELGTGGSAEDRAKRGLVPGLGKVQKIALAAQLGCAILEDRTVKCWGSGRIANDGKPFTGAKPTPVVGVEGAEDIEASGAIVCARGTKGITCWGADENTIGTPPKGTGFKQITTGFSHACALDAKGSVTCWGQGDWNGAGLYAKPPFTGALRVATGDRHGCVIAKDHTVQCWGMNDAGQLGAKADTTPHKKPVTVAGIKGAENIFAGEASTCVVLGDGSVKCWGSNGDGELGLGSRSPDERPSVLTGLGEVQHVCLASSHGCALTKEKKLLCWGSNAFGQLGDGTKERRPSPNPVSW